MFASTIILLLLASIAASLTTILAEQPRDDYPAPRLRRSWHKLSDGEKKAYIDAELCLMKTPTTLGLRGAKTKYDEFQSLHTLQAEISHWVGQFFPFHRLFIYAHEYHLQTLCGYKGAQPYWDESIDAANFSASILLDPILGFGGNGVSDSLCITDGPFAHYKVPIGPGYTLKDQCITRQIATSSNYTVAAAPWVLDACMNYTTYEEFWRCVESAPHGAGHIGVGALMVDAIASPGDPLFFLHHTFLDRIWAKWQDRDLAVRLKEIGGNNRINVTKPFPFGSPFHLPGTDEGEIPIRIPPWNGTNDEQIVWATLRAERPADIPAPQVIGDPGDYLTLTHLLDMHGLVPNRTVAEVMDTRRSLDYEYD